MIGLFCSSAGLYTITWLLCTLPLVVDRELLNDTHLNFDCIKQIRLHFSVCVYCNRSQKTSQRVKNNSHATLLRSSRVVRCVYVFYTLWRHLWSITEHTHKENVIYLLNISRIDSLRGSLTPSARSYTLQLHALTNNVHIRETHQSWYKSVMHFNLVIQVYVVYRSLNLYNLTI